MASDTSGRPVTSGRRTLRPKSVPARFLRSRTNRSETKAQDISNASEKSENSVNRAQSSNYDRLTPQIVYELGGGEPCHNQDSFYGERSLSSMKVHGEKVDAEKSRLGDLTGIEAACEKSDSDSSEDDSIQEPSLEKFKKHKIPQLELRPEQLDSLYIPEGIKAPKKFDFDALKVEIPPYEFEPPLMEQLREINFRSLAENELNWRVQTEYRPQDPYEAYFADRIQELEKMQLQTVEWEDRRRERIRAIWRQRHSNGQLMKGGSVVRHVRKVGKCCPNCLQLACVGDCPTKKSSSIQCLNCRSKFCTGNCQKTSYESHSRQHREDSDSDKVSKSRQRACVPCQYKHTTTKAINSNQVNLGRPRSNYATFSSGQGSIKPVKDSRQPTNATPTQENLEQDFKKLGIESSQSEPTSRPPTGKARTTASSSRGRNGLIPGKSYFSNRRNSLTDAAKPVVEPRPKSAKVVRKRLKSCRTKRPKSSIS